MRVCVIRNAEAKSNAGIMRIIDALTNANINSFTLTRNRFDKGKKGEFLYKPFRHNDKEIANYELQFDTELGKGVKNILQLLLYQYFTLMWLIKNRKDYDAVHAYDLDSGLPALVTSILTKKKLVYHIADFYVDSRKGIPSKFKKIIKKLEFFIISKANVTIICTEEREQQIAGSKPQKLYVIHNSPVDQVIERNIRDDELVNRLEESITLGYVGGLTDTRFINEIINIAKTNSEINLKIAGFGPLEEHVVESSEDQKNIDFYGRVNYEDALNLYSECDLMFAMYDPSVPNHKYSAPNKVYEAMMLGLPIIVAKDTGIDSLVESEKIGFSINYNEGEFLKKVKHLINDKELLRNIKHNSAIAYDYYSWDNMKRKVQEIYNSL